MKCRKHLLSRNGGLPEELPPTIERLFVKTTERFSTFMAQFINLYSIMTRFDLSDDVNFQ